MREEFDVELKEYQHEYLTKMVENFDLPDLGKAVRCLIDYAIDEAELEADIFDFQRCYSCVAGIREEHPFELKEFQVEYLNGIVDSYGLAEFGKSVRCLIDYAYEEGDKEEEIFQLERCHSCD